MKHFFRLPVLLFFLMLSTAPLALAVDVGTKAPGFSLPSLSGQTVSLEDFKGQPVLLKLATTWCPSCKLMSGEIDKAGPFLKEKGVVVLDVFVQDTPEMVKKYLGDSEPPMVFHALIDDGQAYDAYNVQWIPRLLFFDVDQVVRFDSMARMMTAADIRTLVEEFVTEKESSDP